MFKFNREADFVKPLDQLAYHGATLTNILGPIGSGKDTICKIISTLLRQHQYQVVSTSGLIAEHIANRTELGQIFASEKSSMNNGAMASDEAMLKAIAIEIEMKFHEGKRHFLINCAPRTIVQAHVFGRLRKIPQRGIEHTGSLELALHRARVRTNKDIADGEKPREDDHPDAVHKRWRRFENESRPAIDIWKSYGFDCLTLDPLSDLRNRCIAALRHLGYRDRQLQNLAKDLDDRNTPAGQIIYEINNPRVVKRIENRFAADHYFSKNHPTELYLSAPAQAMRQAATQTSTL